MRQEPLSYFAGLTLSLASTTAGAADPAKTTLAIKSMNCSGCVAAVKDQLKRTEAVFVA